MPSGTAGFVRDAGLGEARFLEDGSCAVKRKNRCEDACGGESREHVSCFVGPSLAVGSLCHVAIANVLMAVPACLPGTPLRR